VLEAFLGRGILVAIRVGALMSVAPFFGNASVPNQVKAGLTFVLTALLLPVYAPQMAVSGGSLGWLSMALSELAIGMLVGFATQFVFDGMTLAGQIVSFQFGFSLVNVIDPNSQVDVTVLSQLYELVTLLIFMAMGVQRWVLRAMALSFRAIPLGGAVTFTAPEVLRMSASIWVIGVEIAFPILLGTILTDLTIGFVAKASPQFPALFFGISLKFLMGIAILFGSVIFWPHLLERYFFHAVSNLETLLTFRQ
jgi:flagellar biosynthetic protein FliR